VWVLVPEQTEILRRLTPAAFDDNPAAWAITQAQASRFAGDASGARKYAEQARRAIDEQLRSTPDDPSLHAVRGLALAYLGQNDEALREGERAVALGGPAQNAESGPYHLHQLVRIEIEVGEHEKALDHLDELLKIPYYLTPAWLKIDPNFDPLRNNPRFQKLVAAGK
jgi:tetratricopeptide (TPR) repeat protein